MAPTERMQDVLSGFAGRVTIAATLLLVLSGAAVAVLALAFELSVFPGIGLTIAFSGIGIALSVRMLGHRAHGEQQTRSGERLFHAMADQAPIMIWSADVDGELTYLNRLCYEYSGSDARRALGSGWLGIVHSDDRDRARATVERARYHREPYRLEMRLRRHDGAYRWMISSAAPRFLDDGRFAGFVGTIIDIHDRAEVERQKDLLAREVDHRAKNALAVVTAILRITKADNLEDYVSAVEGRIAAMARGHGLLAATSWQGAPLRRLVEDELGAHDSRGECVKVAGPPVMLDGEAVQPLAILLHEMTTNSLKHGVFHDMRGRILVHWETGQGDVLVFRWQEDLGRPVQPPSREGFGTHLIKTLIEKQLHGSPTFEWTGSGLILTIFLPGSLFTIEADETEVGSTGDVVTVVDPPLVPTQDAPRRILVVEDDVLIADGMVDMLQDLGQLPLGPAHSVAEALKLIDVEVPELVMLDINLGGQLSDPVAARLTELGIPYVHCTGYGDRGGKASDIPALIKPITVSQIAKALALLQRRETGNKRPQA